MYIYIWTNLLALSSVLAVIAAAEEDHSCNSRALLRGYRFTAPPAEALSPDFVSRVCSCRLFALVSCLEKPDLAFSKRNLIIFPLFLVVVTLPNFNRDNFLPWPHIFSSSLPFRSSYIYVCVFVCVCACIYKHACIDVACWEMTYLIHYLMTTHICIHTHTYTHNRDTQ